MNEYEIRKFFPNASASTIARNALHRVRPPDAQQEPNPGDEPVAEAPRAGPDPVFRRVRITSYRKVLLDERNLWDAYFTDALVRAGILFDDSPQYCKVEVSQVQVVDWWAERTTIQITPYP